MGTPTAVTDGNPLAALVAERAGRGDVAFLQAARDDRTVPYAHLPARCATWAAALQTWNVAPGERVVLRIADPLTAGVALVAVIAAGRVAVPVDPQAPTPDVERARTISGARAVVTDDSGGAHDWQVTPVVGSAEDVPAPDVPAPDVPAPDVPAEDVPAQKGDATPDIASGGIALATSGSTGAPKLVPLAAAQLLHVARQVADHNHLQPGDRGYNPLPLFHINAEVVALLATLVAGSTLVLDARFRRTGFFDLVRDQKISWVNGVPAIWSILASEAPPEPLPQLRFVRSASAPLPHAVRAWVAKALDVPVVESYGMTEAASQITATPLDGSAPEGSVGRGIGTEVQVRGDDRALRPKGETGRVWIRGPGVVTSYADTPAAPAAAYAGRFDHDGWLDTGDIGVLDGEGFLTLSGRADDVINRGGELVFPREVEEILHDDRRVREAVVVGRSDDVLGEVPVAFLVLAPDAADEHDAVLADARSRVDAGLARFKRPVEITVVDDLPRASTGKIRRREVPR